MLASLLFFAQADTTSVGYRIGYTIGSWLPFLIIAIIAVMVILKGFSHKEGGEL